jgi:hypothetical protein
MPFSSPPSVRCDLGSDTSTLFWLDPWLNGRCLSDTTPELYAVVVPRACKRTVAAALANDSWIRDISGPLTIPMIVQYLHLRQQLEGVHLDSVVEDRLSWRWSQSGAYSASSAYGAMFLGSSELLGVKQLWKTKAPGEHRFFRWLVLLDRCWTAERRRRHGLQDGDSCALCDQGSETISHLLLGCVYSREVWTSFLQRFGWEALVPAQDASFMDWWLTSRKRVIRRRKAFDSCSLVGG